MTLSWSVYSDTQGSAEGPCLAFRDDLRTTDRSYSRPPSDRADRWSVARERKSLWFFRLSFLSDHIRVSCSVVWGLAISHVRGRQRCSNLSSGVWRREWLTSAAIQIPRIVQGFAMLSLRWWGSSAYAWALIILSGAIELKLVKKRRWSLWGT